MVNTNLGSALHLYVYIEEFISITNYYKYFATMQTIP